MKRVRIKINICMFLATTGSRIIGMRYAKVVGGYGQGILDREENVVNASELLKLIVHYEKSMSQINRCSLLFHQPVSLFNEKYFLQKCVNKYSCTIVCSRSKDEKFF